MYVLVVLVFPTNQIMRNMKYEKNIVNSNSIFMVFYYLFTLAKNRKIVLTFITALKVRIVVYKLHNHAMQLLLINENSLETKIIEILDFLLESLFRTFFIVIPRRRKILLLKQVLSN